MMTTPRTVKARLDRMWQKEEKQKARDASASKTSDAVGSTDATATPPPRKLTPDERNRLVQQRARMKMIDKSSSERAVPSCGM
jgi:hypothetical protein